MVDDCSFSKEEFLEYLTPTILAIFKMFGKLQESHSKLTLLEIINALIEQLDFLVFLESLLTG